MAAFIDCSSQKWDAYRHRVVQGSYGMVYSENGGIEYLLLRDEEARGLSVISAQIHIRHSGEDHHNMVPH